MKRGRISISVFLCFLIMMFLMVMGCSSSGGDAPGPAATTTYSVSGAIYAAAAESAGATAASGTNIVVATSLGTPVAGVPIYLNGAATGVVTGADGTFTVTGMTNGFYTITPVWAGHIFSPSSVAVQIIGANVAAGATFDSIPSSDPTYGISGTVSGAVKAGVLLTLSGAGTATAYTKTDGTYNFTGLVAGSYTVTPSRNGYTFTLASLSPTIVAASIPGQDFTAADAAATYTQSDLTGTWQIHMLQTGSTDAWTHATVTSDSSGNITILSCAYSGGSCSPQTKKWTISSSGVISETSDGSADDAHLTMTANKNFIAGTMTAGSAPQLFIAQKVVPGTVYTSADLQSKSFVFHGLAVGDDNFWMYGTGTTDSAGTLTLTSQTDPYGTTTPGAKGTLSVDSNGVVTANNFNGFLSDDKKTIVGVSTGSNPQGTLYELAIFQVTGKTYTAGALPAGISAAHMLAVGTLYGWIHETVTVDGSGGMTFSNFVTSNGAFTAYAATSGLISASGTVTISEIPSFHGQVSDDGKFMVGIQTLGSGIYGLIVSNQ